MLGTNNVEQEVSSGIPEADLMVGVIVTEKGTSL